MFLEKERAYKTQGISPDTRLAILKYIDEGHTIREAANRFSFHETTIYKLAKSSDIKYKVKGVNLEDLKAYIKENPGLRLKDYATVFDVSTAAISQLLKRHQIEYK